MSLSCISQSVSQPGTTDRYRQVPGRRIPFLHFSMAVQVIQINPTTRQVYSTVEDSTIECLHSTLYALRRGNNHTGQVHTLYSQGPAHNVEWYVCRVYICIEHDTPHVVYWSEHPQPPRSSSTCLAGLTGIGDSPEQVFTNLQYLGTVYPLWNRPRDHSAEQVTESKLSLSQHASKALT